MCRWHGDNWDNEESRFIAYSLFDIKLCTHVQVA
jgi:hypothetical protein